MIRKTLSALTILVLVAFGVTPFGAAEPEAPRRQAGPPTETITLKIEGWACASCEKDIRQALLAVPGVKTAAVSYPRGGAIISVEPRRVSPDQLIKAVEGTSTLLATYRAIVIPNGSLVEAERSEDGVGSFFKRLFQ
ncbi:MAG: heavy-metal-associated domain-containing protein [Nitrospiraceae bacterium]